MNFQLLDALTDYQRDVDERQEKRQRVILSFIPCTVSFHPHFTDDLTETLRG